jgi:ferredoxin
MLERVKTQNAPFLRAQEYDGLKLSSQDLWKDTAKTCVGCGACTNICPTCYCLILNDESESEEFYKVRSYDSCQWHGYARVAAGASPRPFIHERFRNRYLCKFLFMKSNFGRLGCTGCGRCTDACPGEIEFRAVVQSMTEKTMPARSKDFMG